MLEKKNGARNLKVAMEHRSEHCEQVLVLSVESKAERNIVSSCRSV